MIEKSLLAVFLAGIWGLVYAVWMQRTHAGAFFSARLTWLSVVVGVGLTLLIALIVIDVDLWLVLVSLFAASGTPIVIRSLINEHRLNQAVLNSKTTGTTGE